MELLSNGEEDIVENQSLLDDSSKKDENETVEALNNSKENISINVIESKDEEIHQVSLKTLNDMCKTGKNDVMIDLDSGIIKPKILTGPELLFQKYLKTQSKNKKHKDTVSMNILSVENGKVENQKIEVKLDKEVELDHSRPGYSREMLKENLKNQILQQRLEKLKQRFYKSGNDAELEPEDKDHFPHKTDETCEKSDNKKYEEDTSDEEWVENVGSTLLDEEAIDEDDEDSDSESQSSDEEESEDEIKSTQKKGRILRAFEDSDDESSKTETLQSHKEPAIDTIRAVDNRIANEHVSKELKESEDLFNSQATDFTFNEPSVSEEINVNDLGALFDAHSQSNNVDDLMDLCSGQFSATPSQIILTNNDFNISQKIPSTQVDDEDFVTQVPEKGNCENVSDKDKINDDSFVMDVPEKIDDSFVMDVPEKIEETDQQEKETVHSVEEVTSTNDLIQPKLNLNKLLESTDDEAPADDVEEKKKVKRRRKKKKEKMKKLGFSDDENDDEQINDYPSENEENEECVDEEDPEVYLDYDSEENEVEVKLTKKDCQKAAKGYFENEAELSESDWNSADEDEKGMDKYDSDLADEEEFDQNKLREEVGRIHARKILDEDIKNVKKIQELLFEDEENDGVGRDRKFRWKNQGEGFSMEDENARDAEDIVNEQEEENEIMWRRMRHEREMLINEQSQKMTDSESTDILLIDPNSQTVTTHSTSSLVKRKFQIIKKNSSTISLNVSSETNKFDSPFLIKSANTKKFTNSSFLSRGEQTLTKIASFMSSKEDEVTNLSSHGGNSMSFAPIEKKEDSKKRKSDGNNQQDNTIKKRKIENQRFLLDQLK